MIVKRIQAGILLAVLALMLSACSTTSSNNASNGSMGNLLLAEPGLINPRSQMALARYNHILSNASLNQDDMAELFYQRGVLYDSMGLNLLARQDYAQALQMKPNMPEAHNSIGIHYISQMDFSKAYESFDSAIDINPEYDFAFLNRGIALYYGGRPELAIEDLNTFYEKELTDPYRVLWSYLIEQEIDQNSALANLAKRRLSLSNDNWASSIVDFYLGKVDESAVIAKLVEDVKSQVQLNDRLCEAYFYLGKYHSNRGNRVNASNYFKLSLSTNVYEYVEHRYSRIELARLLEQRKASLSPDLTQPE